jgi:GAF domain-containing protein
MKDIETKKFETKEELYKHINSSVKAMVSEEEDWLANLCNITGLIWDAMEGINWIGFYLLKKDILVLGPFQGKPACTRIKLGEGVCGTAFLRRQPVLVNDVHKFSGHIMCDASSNSEMVIPLLKGDKAIGVLDVDSPLFSRFDDKDVEGFQKLAEIISEYVNIPSEY